MMQRSKLVRSSGPLKGPDPKLPRSRPAARFCPSGVTAGIRPLGGSITNEVWRTGCGEFSPQWSGGPIGAAVGAVVGAVSGGVAGKGVAEAINPTTEHEFWRKEYETRPYFTTGTPYAQYGPAFQYGWVSYKNHKGKTFNDVEPQLGRDWESRRGQSKLSWNHAKDATHDAWQRVEKAACSTSCSSA